MELRLLFSVGLAAYSLFLQFPSKAGSIEARERLNVKSLATSLAYKPMAESFSAIAGTLHGKR